MLSTRATVKVTKLVAGIPPKHSRRASNHSSCPLRSPLSGWRPPPDLLLLRIRWLTSTLSEHTPHASLNDQGKQEIRGKICHRLDQMLTKESRPSQKVWTNRAIAPRDTDYCDRPSTGKATRKTSLQTPRSIDFYLDQSGSFRASGCLSFLSSGRFVKRIKPLQRTLFAKKLWEQGFYL